VTGKRKRTSTTTTTIKKAKIAKPKYYEKNKENDFPEPYGQPPVWSEGRQGLCEALPYFNSYQSGTRRGHGMIHGFLIDGEVGDRDHFEDQVIIARV